MTPPLEGEQGLQGKRATGSILHWTVTSIALSLLMAGCATAPPTVAPALTTRQKLAVILQLEHQRVIVPPEGAVVPLPGLMPGTPLPRTPSLLEFLEDPVARVRRRSAIALGRVGLSEAVEPLSASLTDSNPAVRQMAAFSLGLIGEPEVGDALMTALSDPDLLVRGRAAEALSRLGVREAAPTVGQMVSEVASIAAQVDPDDMTYPQPPSV
ncbi:MAG: HEAT repeat domain-containing protein, partial [Acidobacteriota bacterium]|nr:HEAT repeat domain-containing protein [Acidobacteriota bacterium]